MQNYYTKEGQQGVRIPLPFKLKRHFNFYPSPPKLVGLPVKPAQLEGPRALDLPRARPDQPVDWSTGSVARLARWRPLKFTITKINLKSKYYNNSITNYTIQLKHKLLHLR